MKTQGPKGEIESGSRTVARRAKQARQATWASVLAISLVTPVTAVAADDAPRIFDQIIVVASRRDVRMTSGSVQFVAAEQLEQFEYSDINRILRVVPGVNIQEEDGYGLRPNIGLRGTGLDRSSKIAVMEDGVLIAPAPYAGPSAYYFPRAGRMSGIEVVKGPGAIKYGPLTIGGSLQLFSTQVPEEATGKIDGLFGQDKRSQVHGYWGTTYDTGAVKVGVLLETFQDRSDGFKRLDSGGDTGFKIQDYVGKIRLASGNNARFSQAIEFKIQYSDEISDETYLGLTQEDYDASPYRRYRASQLDEMDNEHNTFQLSHTIDFGDDFNLTTIGYYTAFQRNWYKLDKVADPVAGSSSTSSILADPMSFAGAYEVIVGDTGFVSADDALSVKANNREYYAAGIQTALSWDKNLGETSHSLELSVRYHEDEADRFQWVDGYRMDNGEMVLTSAGVPGTDSNRIESAKAWALYLQDEITWGRWTATPGMRFEAIDLKRRDFGKADPDRVGTSLTVKQNDINVVVGGLGISYEANEELVLIAGVHEGFAHPSPGSSADAEESLNYELGARAFLSGVEFELIGFFNDYSNLVGSCTASTGGDCTIGDQFDGGSVDVMGVEATGSIDLGDFVDLGISLPIDFAYTYTDAEFQGGFASSFKPWGAVEDGDKVPYIPDHQFNIGLGAVGERWDVRMNANYTSKTRATAGQGGIALEDKIDGRWVVDLATTVRVYDGVSLYVKAENLFDKAYVVARRPSGLRPGQPQTFSGGFKATF